MLNSIFHAGTFYAESVAAAMATAAILGLMIALLYKHSGLFRTSGQFCGHSGDPAASCVGGHYDREWESGDFGSGFGRFWSGALSQCPGTTEKSVLFSLPWLWGWQQVWAFCPWQCCLRWSLG